MHHTDLHASMLCLCLSCTRVKTGIHSLQIFDGLALVKIKNCAIFVYDFYLQIVLANCKEIGYNTPYQDTLMYIRKNSFVHVLEKYLRKICSEKSAAEDRDRSGNWEQHKKKKHILQQN